MGLSKEDERRIAVMLAEHVIGRRGYIVVGKIGDLDGADIPLLAYDLEGDAVVAVLVRSKSGGQAEMGEREAVCAGCEAIGALTDCHLLPRGKARADVALVSFPEGGGAEVRYRSGVYECEVR